MPQLFSKDTKSCNDSEFASFPKLPAGQAVYEVMDMKALTIEGRLVAVGRFKDASGSSYEHWFNVNDGNDVTARIAQEALKGCWDACGIGNAGDTDMFPNFKGKFLTANIAHKADAKAKEGFFVNFKSVFPATGFGQSAPAHDPADQMPGLETPAAPVTTAGPPTATTPAPGSWKDKFKAQTASSNAP